jgi:hypothetical protein
MVSLEAAYKGHFNILKFLYAQGTDLEVKSEDEYTPLELGKLAFNPSFNKPISLFSVF